MPWLTEALSWAVMVWGTTSLNGAELLCVGHENSVQATTFVIEMNTEK
jgi:hypothetical protein